jgi:hypothetical protein
MSQFPNSRVDDPDDVADALEVARTQWSRGDRPEALKWLRKAADTAFDQGFDERGLELSKTAAELSSNPPPMPSQNAPPATPPPPPSSADATGSRRSVPPGRRTSRNPREPSPRPQGFRPDARSAPAPSAPTPTAPPSRARTGGPPSSPASKSPSQPASRTGPSARPAPLGAKGPPRSEEIPPGDLFAQSIDEFVEESSHPSIPIEETTEIVSLSNFERLDPPKPTPPKASAPAPATTTAPPRVQTPAPAAARPATATTTATTTAKSSSAPARTYGAPVSKPSSPAVQAVASARASQGASSAPARASQTVSRAPSATTTSAPAAPIAAAAPAPVTSTPAQPRSLQAMRVALAKGPGGVQWRLLDDHGLRAGETEVLVVATSPDADLSALLG